MDYISALEASEKWGVSLRQVQRLLADRRIPGAKKYGRSWMIPAGAGKPADPRREKQPPDRLEDDLLRLVEATTRPFPGNNPDAILETVTGRRHGLHYESELSYLRGDFRRTMLCWHETKGDDASRLRAGPVSVAAAISLGDYEAYQEIEVYLKEKAAAGGFVGKAAELGLATATVSVNAPSMVPEWLKAGDFSGLSPEARPDALYLRAKYLHCVGQIEPMLAVAQTALAFSVPERGFTTQDIYLRLTCALACHALDRESDARRWLLEAMRLALPHGLITPFVEMITGLGGLAEECLDREFPGRRAAILSQWQHTRKNWISFHNAFAKDNITNILTLRECHLAFLAARRVPYAQIARQHHLSVGRLKNIMLEIYGKLMVSGRDEMSKRLF